jgi:WD40 repeat protein
VAGFHRSGEPIVTASEDGTVRLWTLDGTRLGTLRHARAVKTAKFNSAQDRLVTTSGDGTARIWDIRTREELAVLRSPDGELAEAYFTADGKRVYTRSESGVVRFWVADAEDLLGLADSRITRDFSEEEKRRYRDLLKD